jgi:hypothetical protein
MRAAQTFENYPAAAAGRHAALGDAVDGLPEGRVRRASPAAGGRPVTRAADAGAAIPVLEPLSGLLPDGLRRGDAVALATRDQAPDYLTLALLAGALAEGLWCAVVGVPELGVLALAGLLGDAPERHLDRLLLVPEPGERWAEVLTALADGVDLLLARPATAVPAEIGRRVDARLRQGRSAGTGHSAALLVLGRWNSARLVLRTAQTVWTGLDGTGPTAGTGQLTGGHATVVAEGRGTAGRPRTVRLWLPTANGTARPLPDIVPSTATDHPPLPPRLTAAA